MHSEQRPALPPLLRLPDELILAILDPLDFWQLQRLERVCKTLKHFVEDPHFEARLFRQKSRGQLRAGREVKLHPLLNIVDCMWIAPNKATIRLDDEWEVNAFDLAACNSFATSPACTRLTINLFADEGDTYDDIVANTAGVTVRDVLLAVAAYWATTGADSYAMLTGEYAFTGWRSPVVLANGTVLLEADYFDH